MLLDIAKKMIRVTKGVAEDRIATVDASKEFVHQSDMFRGMISARVVMLVTKFVRLMQL